jgi:hypothetical protein
VEQEQEKIWIPVRISDSFVDWEGVWELAGEEQAEEWGKVRVAAVADRARGAIRLKVDRLKTIRR